MDALSTDAARHDVTTTAAELAHEAQVAEKLRDGAAANLRNQLLGVFQNEQPFFVWQRFGAAQEVRHSAGRCAFGVERRFAASATTRGIYWSRVVLRWFRHRRRDSAVCIAHSASVSSSSVCADVIVLLDLHRSHAPAPR